MARAQAYIVEHAAPLRESLLAWQLNGRWAIATALLLVASLTSMTRVSEFLYFQF